MDQANANDSVIHIDDAVANLLGKSHDELKALSVDERDQAAWPR